MFHWVKGMNINIKHAQAEISKRIQKFLTDGPQWKSVLRLVWKNT